MTGLLAEVRHAIRVLSKTRGFTAVAALTLALGIGANTAIFSMADAILYRPYPFRELSRIVALRETTPKVTGERYAVSPANYFDWVERNHVFSEMAAYRAWDATLTGLQDPQPVRGYLVSPGFFPLLGVPPIQGRLFAGEHTNERNQVVVSYGFWQERLGADPNVLGRALVLNGLSYTVAGVMQKEVDFPMYADVWAPWIPEPGETGERVRRELSVIARLKPGVSLAQAQAEMRNISARLAVEYPLANAGRGAGVVLLREVEGSYTRRFMAVVTVAVGFLLLLACANVANLQLARGAARRREMALRAALGAGRARIARQLFTEGILLSLLGTGLGLPLAVWGLALIKVNMPQLVARHLPGLVNAGLDLRMLAFACAAAFVTGIAFTFPAAGQAFSASLQETVKQGGRGAVVSGGRMRSVLVVSEIGFAFVLLIGAALMVKGFRNLATMKQGFDPDRVLSFRVPLPESEYRERHQVLDFYQEALRRLGALPEIRSAAVISELPALADSRSSPVSIEGQPLASPDQPLLAEVRVTSEDYFRTMAIPLAAGRGFSCQDSEGALAVAVISKRAARRFWPGQDAIGRRLRLESPGSSAPWLTVVGVAGDVRHFFLDSEVRPTVYVPYLQQPIRSLSVVMKLNATPEAAARAIRAAMRTVDATRPVYNLESIGRFFSDLAGGVEVVAALLGVFGVIALVLSSAGTYAMMAYSVARRTQEIGVRVALGAGPGDVLALVLGQAARLVAASLALGLPAAIALGRVMSSVLSGVVALAPLPFVGFTILLAAVGLLAGYVPARRALSVDPLAALRSE